jgi:ABC-type proline/glycine betaine transport system permease subunit
VFRDRLDAIAAHVWLRAVDWVNKLFASVFAAISAAYAAYPESVKAFLKQVPEWAVFPAAVAVFIFINHALKQAKGK